MALSSMDIKQTRFKVIDLAIIAIFAGILFVTEELLTFLPNIQLTVFLLVLYSKKFGFIKTTIIILIHVILDNLVMGSFNIMFVPFMFLGWFMIPLLLKTVFRKVNSFWGLAILGILFSFLYCVIMMVPTAILFNVDVFAYFLSDLPWEGIMALSSFISILFLYVPCSKALDFMQQKQEDSVK